MKSDSLNSGIYQQVLHVFGIITPQERRVVNPSVLCDRYNENQYINEIKRRKIKIQYLARSRRFYALRIHSRFLSTKTEPQPQYNPPATSEGYFL